MSAAFDTVDHDILLERLSKSLGITGSAHHWIRSFLTSRTQTVHVGTSTSTAAPVRWGVPQSSVLDLSYMSFTLRMSLGSCHPSAWAFTSMRTIRSSTTADWLRMRKRYRDWSSVPLKQSVFGWHQTGFGSIQTRLNSFGFGTRQQLAKRNCDRLSSVSPTLVSATHVRNLGVILDSGLLMGDHISQLCHSCFFQLRRLRAIRHSLTRKSILMLVHSFICNRIDYCNSVLYGASRFQLDRLQSILNAAARIILRIPKFSHILASI